MRRPWARGTAIVGFAIVAVYIALIIGEGTQSFLGLLPWATFMAMPAVAAFVASQIKDRRRARNVMIAAAVLFAVLGVISIFSIGLGFLLAAALAAIAALRLNVEPSLTQ